MGVQRETPQPTRRRLAAAKKRSFNVVFYGQDNGRVLGRLRRCVLGMPRLCHKPDALLTRGGRRFKNGDLMRHPGCWNFSVPNSSGAEEVGRVETKIGNPNATRIGQL